MTRREDAIMLVRERLRVMDSTIFRLEHLIGLFGSPS